MLSLKLKINIPAVMDGLVPVQRKILYCPAMKMMMKQEALIKKSTQVLWQEF
jgi:DNA gyrase/topoisomerase IV subunit A